MLNQIMIVLCKNYNRFFTIPSKYILIFILFRDERKSWIRDKYVEKKYLKPLILIDKTKEEV